MKLRFGLSVTALLLVAWAVVVAQRSAQPLVITRIYTGPDGLSRAERVDAKFLASTPPDRGVLENFQAGTVSGDAVVLRTSPDYFSDWHSVANRRYVITLSGRRQLEVGDGTKIDATPGSIMLVEDTTGKGHITRGVGSEGSISMVIPLPAK